MRPIHIAGPTAVGKSALALALPQQFPAEIISVDSMQVYQGLDIGTAKPTTEERQRVPHHLLDIRTLDQAFDAHQFTTLAKQTESEIINRGAVPIYCGGTGLYFKAVREGLDPLPPGDPDLRAELEALPLETLNEELRRKDPITHGTIDQQNARRVVRAVEIIRLTGKPLSTQRTRRTTNKEALPTLYVLYRSPEMLRLRIEQRVDVMFETGLVAETEAVSQALEQNQTASQALGYRQVLDHLAGERTLEETIARVKTKTWQFARRQLTWFRKQAQTHWIDLDHTSLEEQCQTVAKGISS